MTTAPEQLDDAARRSSDPAVATPADGAFVLEARPPTHRRRRRLVVLAAVVGGLVLVSGAALGVRASNADPQGGLRTAIVQNRSVTQTLEAVATVEPVTQATVAFPVSGTVATVEVAAGDAVLAGQALATLDTTDLQTTIHERQADLARAQLALQQDLTASTTGTSTSSVADAATSSGAASGDPSAVAASSGGSGSTSSTVTAADLVADQQAVAAAAADLRTAEQAVEQATIVSPVAGTVASVGLGAGDSVTAGSASSAVVVVGDGGYELTTSVAVADLPDVRVGQAVTVRPDAGAGDLDGTVVAIAVAPDSSGSSYAVTIGISGEGTGLRNGSTASVSIVTGDEADATSVPTSAVTTDGDRSTVTLVDADGATTEREVTVGAIGGAWTALTSGVEAGQTVVLAAVDEPLPGSATDGSAATTTRGAGGPPGQGGTFTGAPPAGAGPRPGS